MKKFLILLGLTGCVEFATAQGPATGDPQRNTDERATSAVSKSNGHIFGVVKDSTAGSPVEFANIAIVDPTTHKPINGTVCDDKGKFSITKVATGHYQVVISFIGYQTKTVEVLISDTKNEADLGLIKLSLSAKILHEIIVQGQKALVEEKVDRMVYHAENDLTTKGGDATDVLKRVPLLTVDMDGNVSLKGSSSLIVLINNKPSTITSNSVADALKQIPADMIKNVEVITSPSSKYDAEGSAGIINIVLKKNTLEGVFLTADGSFGNRGSNAGLQSSYRKGKMGFSLAGFNRNTYHGIGKFSNQQTTRQNGDTVLNIQRANTYTNGVTNQVTLGWDYDINKTNSLTTSLRYGQRNQNSYQDDLFTETYPLTGPPSFRLQKVKNTTVSDNVDASLNYTRTFTKKDRELNFMAIYSRNNPTTGFVTDSLSQVDRTVLRSYKNENRGHTQEVTVQADFQEPIRTNQLIEFGAKDIVRTVNSDYTYSKAGSNGEYQLSGGPLLSNGFNYNQSITSGYLSYTLTTANNYTLKAGGRYEYTNIHAHFQGKPDIAIPSYGVFVPSINISRKLKNGNLIKASYNRRIQRPSLRDLNPNLQASNPLNATIGNPNLKPEFADNYELSYKTFMKGSSINLSTFIRNNTNDIQQARMVRHDTIIAIFQNIGAENNYGVSIFVSIPISSRFSINGGTDMFYRVLKNNSNDPFINATNQGLVRNYRLFGNYNFSNGWAMQFFSNFQGRSINLQGYRTNPISYSLSVKKDVLGKNGSVGLGVDNFATRSYPVHSQLTSAYLAQYTTNTLYLFAVKVNFSYKIGRLSQDRKAKKALEEEDTQ
jgi:outer membrane receptor protein involved in Fe transport